MTRKMVDQYQHQYQQQQRRPARQADPTAMATTSNSNGDSQQQQCVQMESITHQLQHAGLSASSQQQVAFLLQQQQLEIEHHLQVQALYQQHQQQQQRQRANGGMRPQAFAVADMPYLSAATVDANQREHDMDMVSMLPLAWPQSPRTSGSESLSLLTGARWNFGSQGLGSGLEASATGFSDLESGEQVFFAPMDFPLVPAGNSGADKTQAAARNREAIVRDFGAEPQSHELFDKMLQGSRNRIGPSPTSMTNGFGSGLGPPLSNHFEINGVISGEFVGEPNFQPVLDSTSLEPLDETSLELLVSSLSHISGDQSTTSNQQTHGGVGSNGDDTGNNSAISASYNLSEYLRRSHDLSENDSDSSSISSNSPRGSSFKEDHSAGTADNGGSATSRSAATGSSGNVPRKKPKRIRRLCTQPNCGKRARSQGLCIAHGGGRRCAVEGCEKSSQGGNMCIKHGGGKRCSVSDCNKAAQTNSLCKAHGGGPRCQIDGCDKSSQGGGFCRSHGGGKRCAADGCDKGTQRGEYCALHGGSRFCEVSGCRRNDRGGGLCAHHGGGKRCDILNCVRPCRRNGFCSTHLRLLGGDDSA